MDLAYTDRDPWEEETHEDGTEIQEFDVLDAVFDDRRVRDYLWGERVIVVIKRKQPNMLHVKTLKGANAVAHLTEEPTHELAYQEGIATTILQVLSQNSGAIIKIHS